MGEITKVSWTDSTWNPVIGCRAVSPGCEHCYARTLVNGRMGGDFSKRRRTALATFNAPLRWNKKPWVCEKCGGLSTHHARCLCPETGEVAKWHQRRVFLGSLMDIFDPETPIEWLADALDIVRRCPDLIFQTVTKRPELWLQRMIECSLHSAGYRDGQTSNLPTAPGNEPLTEWLVNWGREKIAPQNVWVIASVEDQKRAEERIPELLKIPAVVHGLSVEPLLETVEFSNVSGRSDAVEQLGKKALKGINWVIVGGESGPGFRDCGVNAIEDVARQCKSAGVKIFVKQDCSLHPGKQGRISNDIWNLKQFP